MPSPAGVNAWPISQIIKVLHDCQFITFPPVGIGLTGITGAMDDAIATLGLYNVIGAALPDKCNPT